MSGKLDPASDGVDPLTPGRLRLRMGDGRALGIELVRTYGIVIALLVLVIVVASQNSVFISQTNLLNISSQWAPDGVMAAGLTFVLIAGGIDLSIGANFNLCAVVAAAIGQHHNPGVAFAAALALGTGIGFGNALIVTVTGIDSFIATLGVSFALTSISEIITANQAYYVNREDFLSLGAGSWHTIPYAGLVMFGTFLVLGVVLWRGAYGQKIYAVGGNREASRLAGLRVQSLSMEARSCWWGSAAGSAACSPPLSSGRRSTTSIRLSSSTW